MTGKIFINYRRGDEPGFTQALLGRLEHSFPAEQLFIDVDNIPPGEDFVHVLESQVAQCDTLLAVIGKGWLLATNELGSRRLDDPNDFVRIEIESALKQGKRVIPVLVNEARMPRPDQLPEALRPLARRNAVRLTHERFRADLQGLVKALQRELEEVAALRPDIIGAVVAQGPEPRKPWQPSRRALLFVSVLGVILVGSVGVWVADIYRSPISPVPTPVQSPPTVAPSPAPVTAAPSPAPVTAAPALAPVAPTTQPPPVQAPLPDPNSAEAYSKRADAYVMKNEYDQAIADYTKAIALKPDAALYNDRGNAYSAQHLYDQAIDDYTKAIALDPKKPIYYDNRADQYIKKGLYDQAIADATESLSLALAGGDKKYLSTGGVWAYTHRGYAYEQKGLRNQAISDYRAALRLDPSGFFVGRAREGLSRLGAAPK